jgi:hypothetical protein
VLYYQWFFLGFNIIIIGFLFKNISSILVYIEKISDGVILGSTLLVVLQIKLIFY